MLMLQTVKIREFSEVIIGRLVRRRTLELLNIHMIALSCDVLTSTRLHPVLHNENGS